jgi:3-oxoacyl-[acyl-carrier protein] reductase
MTRMPCGPNSSARDFAKPASPGRIDTDRVRELDALSADPEATRRASESRIPLRRYGAPEEFGRAAAFLLSPAASYLTGIMLPVDGGVRHGF